MSATLISRRSLLAGGAAFCVLAPRTAFAQTTTPLGLSSTGHIIVDSASMTGAQRAAFGSIATAVARAAPSRAAATATINAVASRMMFLAPSAGLGLLAFVGAAAVAGTAYYLYTGNNPIDGLLDLATPGSPMLEFKYSGGCDGVPKRSAGSALEAGIMVGIFNDVPDNSTTCVLRHTYRQSVGQPATSSSCPLAPQVTGYSKIREVGKYNASGKCSSIDVWYSKLLDSAGGSVKVPANADLKNSLSTAQKLKVLSESTVNFMGVGGWEDYQGWADGGFTGGGGGDFGGGGASGTWGDNVPAEIKTGASVRGGVSGTGSKPSPTMEDAIANPTPYRPPTFSYPSQPMFPDDPGFNPTAPSPGGSGGSSGGSTGPSCYPGQPDCPVKVEWGGAPTDTAYEGGLGSVNPMKWFPSPFTPPTVSTTCNGVGATFPLGIGYVGINPCPVLSGMFPIVRPVVILGATIQAGRVILDI
jgi:uncharacterized membrane protein YgcG